GWESRDLVQLFRDLWPQLAHDVIPRQNPHRLSARLVVRLTYDDHLLITCTHVIQCLLYRGGASNVERRTRELQGRSIRLGHQGVKYVINLELMRVLWRS